MYKVPGQRYDKSQKHSPICLWQSVVVFQKAVWRKLFQTRSTSRKPCCNGRLLLRLHHAVCKWHALQLLPLAVASVQFFGFDDHSHAFTAQPFCPVFSDKINIMSTLFVHQSLILSQKIDSREGLFWCRKGLHCECDEMNFYLKRPPFATDFGLFAAKHTAFWC